MIITIQANGKTDATEVIADNGFTDIFPNMDFYEEEKVYKKNGKYYTFAGWNSKVIKRKRIFPSLKMEEINYPTTKE
jgi:hypothetical protein